MTAYAYAAILDSPQVVPPPESEEEDDGACWTCGGSGWFRIHGRETVPCPDCDGTGREP